MFKINELKFALSLTLLVTLLAGCITAVPQTPTTDPNVLITQIAQTVAAEITKSAALTPSPTATLLPPTVTATITPLSGIATLPSTAPGIPSAPGPDNAVWIEDVSVPDGTVFLPNEKFTKQWKIQNMGTTTWNINYKLVYLDGKIVSDVMSVAMVKPVEPGNIIIVSVPMKAPAVNGSYTTWWKMLNDKGQFFGDPLYVQFIVGTPVNPTATPPSG